MILQKIIILKETLYLKFLEIKLVPVARKLDQNRYLTAIKDGFFAVMPLLIIGSMFLLIPNIPSETYQNFMASKLGDNWSDYVLIPFNATMNLMTLFVIIGMAKSLGRSFDIEDVTSIVTSIVAFIILTPMVEIINDGGEGLPVANFTAVGLFVGIFTTMLALKIFSVVQNKGWITNCTKSNYNNTFYNSTISKYIINLFCNISRNCSFS